MAFSLQSALRAPSLLLLVSLIVLMLGSAVAEQSESYALILGVLFVLSMLAAVRVVTNNRRDLMISIGLALAWLVFDIWDLVAPAPALRAGASVAFILFAIFVIENMLRGIVTAKVVNAEVIFASASVYLLIAVTWAMSYGLMDLLAPGSFGVTVEGAAASFNHFLYFSLTTLTTLGYGDITPVSSLARIWSTLEAMTGVFYLAVLVARLVSLYRS